MIEFADKRIFEAQASAWERVERFVMGQQSVSIHLPELDIGVEEIRNIVRQYRPHLLGSENPLFRA